MRNTLLSLSTALGLAMAIFVPDPCGAATPTLKTLVSLNGTANGANPYGGVIGDGVGNLFGTTKAGGANNVGTVFEILKTFSGYANATTLISFDGTNWANPQAGLIIDLATGKLFGTTLAGGAGGANQGTVFALAKTSNGYASTPTTLMAFSGTFGANPAAGLIADANGNLFGTTLAGGAFGFGTVFEVLPGGGLTLEISLNGASGARPVAGLVIDTNGNLFGTASVGGVDDRGTVFEIAKTANGYASTPTLLVVFDGAHGRNPYAGLTIDLATGNLFGTTTFGGANNQGTVFELVNTANGYASTPTILYNFCSQPNCTDGAEPQGELIIDANGNLFGTTYYGGANAKGTVFEIAKTSQGYASTPTTLVSFNLTNGSEPQGHLIADANGNLFGATLCGGAGASAGNCGSGTVFEIVNSGFVPSLALKKGPPAQR